MLQWAHDTLRHHGTKVAILFALVLQLVTTLRASPSIHDYEEMYIASHAWLVREGGLSLVFPLQYQPFCGGCSIDALIGAGSFLLLGPSLLAWRMVSLAFFIVALMVGTRLARDVGGHRAATVTALLFAVGPPTFQELTLISNGNHPEGGAILLMELLLASQIGRMSPGPRREGVLALLGLLVGFGMFFLRSLVLGVPVLMMAFVMAPAPLVVLLPRLLLVCLAVALGLSPILEVRQIFGAWPIEPIYQPEEWSLSLRWLPHNLATLLHPQQLRGIWGDTHTPRLSWLGLPAFGAWIGILLVFARRSLRRLRGSSLAPDDLHARRTSHLLLATLAAFFGLYLVFRLSVWMDGQTPPYAQQLRYLGLVYPLILVVAGCGLARAPRFSPPAILAALIFVLPGILARVRVIVQGDWFLSGRRQAADWCFQEERVRGRLDVLERASIGNPLDLVALSAGLVARDPGFAHAAINQLPRDPTPPDPNRALAWTRSWQRGEVMAIMTNARDAAQGPGSFPLWMMEVVRRLDSPLTGDVLWEAAWCHGQSALADGAFTENADAILRGNEALWPSTARPIVRELWSVARGLGAGRTCVARLADRGLEANWTPDCGVWMDGLSPEAMGWAMGATIGEARAGELRHLRIRLPEAWESESRAKDFRAGWARGWTWACEMYWIPARLPDLHLEWSLSDQGLNGK